MDLEQSEILLFAAVAAALPYLLTALADWRKHAAAHGSGEECWHRCLLRIRGQH